MIDIKRAKSYCENYEDIENYEKAVVDTKTWDCHHRKEIEGRTLRTAKDLKDAGLYYNRPAEELIFLTHSEHVSLHMKGNTYMKGKTFSKEAKKKLSEAKKGNKNGCKGKVQCIETGKVYDCGHDAEKELGICNISRACREGGRAGRFHWRYCD